MKKGLLLIAVVAVSIACYFIFFKKNTTTTPEVKVLPLAQSANSDSFNKPFNDLLNKYFDVKNDLVNWDSTKADEDVKTLITIDSGVPYNALKADTTIIQTALSFSQNVIAEAQGLLGDKTIDAKRHDFYTLSENLYNLIRTVRYDQQIIYHDKCPMAFNGTDEGYWLSNEREIVNPYFGKKHPKYFSGMIACGNIEDSINFVKK